MNQLKRKRKMLGLTQYEVAKRSGILYSRITFAETNRRKLTKRELERIERFSSGGCRK